MQWVQSISYISMTNSMYIRNSVNVGLVNRNRQFLYNATVSKSKNISNV